MQRLTKAHIDQVVGDLVAGGTKSPKGRTRRPWSAVAVNKVISTIDQVLDDFLGQKIVTADVAAKVARVSSAQTGVDTFTIAEVARLREQFKKDRIGHAWELALYGFSARRDRRPALD